MPKDGEAQDPQVQSLHVEVSILPLSEDVDGERDSWNGRVTQIHDVLDARSLNARELEETTFGNPSVNPTDQ